MKDGGEISITQPFTAVTLAVVIPVVLMPDFFTINQAVTTTTSLVRAGSKPNFYNGE